jgi:histone H3/H4
MAQTLVVTSKIKALAKIGGLRTSAEFIDALSKAVGSIVISAAKQAKADNRGTIKARDLPVVLSDD